MGYSSSAQGPKPRPWKIHPIWRGIGCIMLLIIPIVSWAGAVLLVQQDLEQGWMRIPREMARSLSIPYLGTIPYFYATVITAVLLMVLGFAAMMVIYGIAYRIVGPSTLGPLDAPPERRKVRKSRLNLTYKGVYGKNSPLN